MSNEVLLRHHGILGMKWGVRRTPEQLARASGKKNSSDDEVKKMSDSELRSKINRLLWYLRTATHPLWKS